LSDLQINTMLLVINANLFYIQAITIVKFILLRFKFCKLKKYINFFYFITDSYDCHMSIVPLISEIDEILFFFINLINPEIIFSQF